MADSSSGLAKKTLANTVWGYVAFASSKGAAFVTTIILARILAPEDFGLLALGLLAVNYLDVLRDFGVGPALIYRQEDPEQTADVAFVLSVANGIILTAAAFLCAPLVAAFFGEPRVVNILRVLSASFFISSLGNIHVALLTKELDFRRRLGPEIGRALAKGGVSIGMALAGFGVWSLVWGQIAGVVVTTLLVWLVTRRKPRLRFDVQTARVLMGYGLQIMLVNLFGAVYTNIDYLFVGRRQDSEQLGYYTMAFRLPELIIISLVTIVGQAIFPAYATLQDDMQVLRRGFITLLRYVATITIPIGVGMFIIAPEFIYVFYTESWAPAIPVMQMLSLYAISYALSYNAGDVYKAIGRPGILNQIGVLKLVVALPVLWWAAGRGIYHVALGQLGTNILLTIITLGIASRILGVRFSAILGAFKSAAVGALVMVIGTYALRTQILDFTMSARLALLVLCGSLLYMATLWLIDRATLIQALEVIKPAPARQEIH